VSGLAGVLLGVASAASAHPGHGLDGGSESWLHYLSDPLHVAPLALAAVTLVLAARRWREARARARTRIR
jgi:hypothetical protein